MTARSKKWIKFSVRWGIAIAGMCYVVWNLSLHDRVMVQQSPDEWPQKMRLAAPAGESDAEFSVYWPSSEGRFDNNPVGTIERSEVLVRADRDRVTIRDKQDRVREVELLGLRVDAGDDVSRWPLVVAEPRSLLSRYLGKTSEVWVATPERVVGVWRVGVPYPIVEVGLVAMIRRANPLFLWASIFVFPLTFLITSIRWHHLLKALDIHMGLTRAFAINMVGSFYNTFMPGSTGGDVLKAYYAAKQAPDRRTRAVMSVLVDRAIGLMALVVMGGSIAAYQYGSIADPHDPTSAACKQVAVGSGLIIAAIVLGLAIFYTPALRRATGMNFVLQRLPMQAQVQKAIETMQIYRRRPLLVVWAMLISFPVHATVVTSAMLAGLALQLPMGLSYYWVVVPVVVLAGAIPISPQGAGVMEFFAILLTKREGMTVSQAFALTMSIRIVQILWNLAGGLFLLRGGYHAPTAKEEAEVLEADSQISPSTDPALGNR